MQMGVDADDVGKTQFAQMKRRKQEVVTVIFQ